MLTFNASSQERPDQPDRTYLTVPRQPLASVARSRRNNSGFTLLESALALVIVGVGIVALIEAHTNLSRANSWSTQSATAAYLAGEIRERLRKLPRHDAVNGVFIDSANRLAGWGIEGGPAVPLADYNDVDDYTGVTFGSGGLFPGPIDAQGNIITAVDDSGVVVTVGGVPQPMAGWSQQITVEKVEPTNFATVRAPAYFRNAVGATPGITVDAFPLRVTVVVWFQGINDLTPLEMARLTWITP